MATAASVEPRAACSIESKSSWTRLAAPSQSLFDLRSCVRLSLLRANLSKAMLHFHYFKNTILRFIAALAILACVSMTATLNAADAKPKPNPDKKPAPKVEPKAKPDAKAKPANKPIATVDADKKANPKAAKKPEPAKQPTAEAKAKADDKDKAAKKPKAKDKTDAEKKARKKKRAAKGKGKGKASAKARPAPTLVAAENNEVTIPKKAFGREYLMSGSVIPQSEAATSTGLAGKIVRFELFHDGVDLYESTQGLVVTDEHGRQK
jgi:outer membrane biosynthesis protein TonB